MPRRSQLTGARASTHLTQTTGDASIVNGQSDPIVEPENTLPEIHLPDLSRRMQEAARRAGWTELMPVQRRAIPYMLEKRDLMCQSRTGSGKTGAFVLPIIERVDPGNIATQALVLVPTRELASQVAAEATLLAGDSGVKVVSVYGGVGYGPQLKGFQEGAQIVVGTPGRILDHLIRRSLSLNGLRILVFDEADRMLSMGFYPDMKRIQEFLPDKARINAYMFSATFPTQVIRLAKQFMHRPELLSLSRDRVHVAETEHVFYAVPGMEKDRCLVRIIETENPASAIIFCNTKAQVHYVTVVLQRFGYDADELSADLKQRSRERLIERLKKGNLRFLVATDLAARGIDIHELSHVILFEPPEDPELYIHRAGRTGRAGATGQAITLVFGQEQSELMRIGRRFSIEFLEKQVPSDDDVARIASERLTAMLEARLRDRDKLQSERMQRFLPLTQALSETDEGRNLLAMMLDDYYQETLHGPQTPLTDTPSEPATGGGDSSQDKPRKKPRPRRRRSGGGRKSGS
ncbi:DEAD/DEAH box helicase [candidate division GN15 bacterium]|nr:DEAD/DEAH box helicase [candidate division GN15 bacterium]